MWAVSRASARVSELSLAELSSGASAPDGWLASNPDLASGPHRRPYSGLLGIGTPRQQSDARRAVEAYLAPLRLTGRLSTVRGLSGEHLSALRWPMA